MQAVPAFVLFLRISPANFYPKPPHQLYVSGCYPPVPAFVLFLKTSNVKLDMQTRSNGNILFSHYHIYRICLRTIFANFQRLCEVEKFQF